jgi:hypothetical protein
VKNSDKFSYPIYSNERYEAEINRYRTKRNIEIPHIPDRSPFSKTVTAPGLQKELSKTRLNSKSPVFPNISRNSNVSLMNSGSITSRPKHKFAPTAETEKKVLNMDDFQRKYET